MMNVIRWLVGCFSDRGKALSLYRRGMAKANARDRQGAINDYTESIGNPSTPIDVRAMVLYNRALMHAALGNNQKAYDDLEEVLAADQAPANIKTMARQKIARLGFRSRNCPA